MSTLQEELTRVGNNVLCTVGYAASFGPDIAGAATRSIDGLAPVSDTLASQAEAIRGLFCPTQDSLNPLPPGSEIPPRGGQCPGVQYRVDCTALCNFNPATFGLPDRTYEAVYEITSITGPVYDPIIPGALVGGISSGNPPLNIGDENGNFLAPFFGVSNNGGDISAGDNQVIELISITFTRLDGMPDTCPEVPPSPPRYRLPIQPDEPTGPGPVIDVDIIVQPPVVDITGNLIVPIIFAYLDADINANFNLSVGEINFNFGNGPGVPEGDRCCLPPDDDVPELPPEDDDPPPPDDGDRKIVGLVVSINPGPNHQSTQVGDASGEVLYLPRLSSLHFHLKVGNAIVNSEQIELQRRKLWVPAPADVFAFGWQVLEYQGSTTTVNPVYSDV